MYLIFKGEDMILAQRISAKVVGEASAGSVEIINLDNKTKFKFYNTEQWEPIEGNGNYLVYSYPTDSFSLMEDITNVPMESSEIIDLKLLNQRTNALKWRSIEEEE